MSWTSRLKSQKEGTEQHAECNQHNHRPGLHGWGQEIYLAQSWKITLHTYDLLGSCCKSIFETRNPAECEGRRFESTFSSKRYCFVVDPCSSHFPDPHAQDQVTSFAVVCPGNLITPV